MHAINKARSLICPHSADSMQLLTNGIHFSSLRYVRRLNPRHKTRDAIKQRRPARDKKLCQKLDCETYRDVCVGFINPLTSLRTQ